MNPEIILMLVKTAMIIIESHSTKPTPEQVAAEIAKELADGKSIIAKWFVSKGLTPPQ